MNAVEYALQHNPSVRSICTTRVVSPYHVLLLLQRSHEYLVAIIPAFSLDKLTSRRLRCLIEGDSVVYPYCSQLYLYPSRHSYMIR